MTILVIMFRMFNLLITFLLETKSIFLSFTRLHNIEVYLYHCRKRRNKLQKNNFTVIKLVRFEFLNLA